MYCRLKRVVFWGYPLHTHTNSYVYAGFKKAFDHLGYETCWYFDHEDHTNESFDDCIFFAFSGQMDNIPLNKSCKYILHNADPRKFIDAGCQYLFVQTLHNEALNRAYELSKINDYTFVDRSDGATTVFTPWATDLLPHEFDFDLPSIRTHICTWVGTYGDFDGIYQNGQQLKPFFDKCDLHYLPVRIIDPWKSPVSFEDNYHLIRDSLLAPAIQGKWQVVNEYPPCRLFKNISYGNFGISNNKKCADMFGPDLVYHEDSEILFEMSAEAVSRNDTRRIKSLMMDVRAKHTYLNRINTLLTYL